MLLSTVSASAISPAISISDAQGVVDGSPFGPWWGFIVRNVASGSATVELPARPELMRPGNILQGGCCMTLADVAFWIAIMTLDGIDDPSVTLEMKTNFLRGSGTDLSSTARLINNGRRIAFGDATTTDADGRMIAHHTLTYIRPT